MNINRCLFTGGTKWPSLPPVGQTGHHQRATRVSSSCVKTGQFVTCVSVTTLWPCVVCVCVYQVSEGPDVVRDGRPLPVEAFPGSPVSPGDRSWDALDRPQPHRLLPQKSQSTFFLFSLSLIYLMNIQKSELSSVMKSSMQSGIFSEHLFMLHFHWLKKHACICQLIAEEGEQK